MATTFVVYTGDGDATKQFTFPSIQESDVKVEVDGVIKSSGTHYNITSYTTTGGGNVVFTSGNEPASPAAIRIFRDTDVDSAKATYTAGSSVKAADLNANHEQLLFAAQEEQNQTVLTSDIKDGAVTSAKIKNGTIEANDLAANSIIEQKIADNAVTMAKLGSGALPTDITVTTDNIVNLTIATADIADDAVTADKIADSVNAAIATNTAKTTNQTHTGDVTGSVALTIANDAVTSGKIAANAVTTAKIADAELKTLAGMQSATASKLADSTALTADIADLNQIDGMAKQTTITDDDTKFPTSGAIVDYVAAQLEPFGGFEAIANEVSFPNTQPPSGVAISIADAAGIVVNSSGVSTTGRTVGGTTVTINNIPSNFHSSTIATGIRFIVTSTGSSQTYNYHKATLAETDLVSLSGDINDFNERYRVGSENPSSNNDAGDLFFNTSTNKLLVYNTSTSAFEETQSVGNFFINTLSSSSSTGGGSATFNNNAYRFTLSNPGANAQQHLVSINGVVQKPNSGSSQPSEGFAISGADIIFSAAPASGADFFIITIGASVSIGTPSNNTVTSAILQNGSVINSKLGADAVDGTKIADDSINSEHYVDNSINAAHIANDAVGADQLANTSVSAGSYGTASAIPAITVDAQGRITAASTNAVSIPPAVGGANGVDFNDDIKARFGTGNDLQIFHDHSGNRGDAQFNKIEAVNSHLDIQSNNTINITYPDPSDASNTPKKMASFSSVGCDLRYQDTTKLLTTNTGVTVTGTVAATAYTGDGSSLTGVASTVADGCIYENSQTISNNYTITTNKNAMSAGPITVASGATLTIPSGSTYTIV